MPASSVTPPLLSPTLDVVFKCLFASEPVLLAELVNAVLLADGYAPVATLVDRETVTQKG